MKNRWYLLSKTALICAALTIVLGGIFPVHGQTQSGTGREKQTDEEQSAREESVNRHFREVAERVRQEGTIPVIVRLRSGLGGVGAESLRQDQNALLDELVGYDPSMTKQFRHLPYIGVSINAAGLERLRSSARVLDIQEDNAVHPAMNVRKIRENNGEAATTTHTGAGETIALIGTGIGVTQDRLVTEGCFSTTDANRRISSLCGAVAKATIGAGTIPGADAIGGEASVIALQVFSRLDRESGCPSGKDSCLVAFDSDVIRALERVYDLRSSHRIAAVSLNLSNPRLMENCDESGSAMKAAIRLLADNGIATVAAAENGGGSRSCIAGAISAASLPAFGGDSDLIASAFAAARQVAPGAGIEAILAALRSIPADRTIGNSGQDSGIIEKVLGQLADLNPLPGDRIDQNEINRIGSISGMEATSVLATPTNLLASALSTSQVELTWIDNSSNEISFVVRRRTNEPNSSWIIVATLAPNTTVFRDADLFPGTSYIYSVLAQGLGGETRISNEYTVQLPIYNFLLFNNGRTVSNSVPTNRQQFYRLTVPYGATQLLVQTNGTGNADLYVRFGKLPELNRFECRSILDSSADRCVFSYPQAGDWYIMVYGNSRSVINYLLSATYLMGMENNIPTAPSNLIATGTSSSQVSLSWNDNSINETGFSIRRRLSSDAPWTQVAIVGQNVTSYYHTGLDPNLTYYYSIVAYNLAGVSAPSNEAFATTPGSLTSRPLQPTNLQAVAAFGPVINLSWNDNSNNEAGFSVRRRTAVVNVWSVIATVGANINTYQDTQVNSGTTYYYTITATNIAGESTISNEAGATTFGGLTNVNLPPVNVQASANSTSEVVLRWTDNSVSEAGFRIRRKEGEDGPWVLIAIVDRNVTTYLDSGLTPGISYTYKVSSYIASAESENSNEVVMVMPLYDFTPLENDQKIPHTVGRYRIRYYRINVPIGASELWIHTKGIGSTDMYVRAGLQPTNFFYNCRSLSDTTNNRCLFINPEPGDWHVMITSTTAIGSNYELTCSYKMGANLNILTPTAK